MKQKIHPLFEIILDNWRPHGFATEKKPAKATVSSTVAEKKAKNTYTFPRRVEKKEVGEWQQRL